MKELGPVDYMIVAFPGNKFRGEIAPALADLVDNGTIRIIDLAFVGKNAEGEVVAFELMDLEPDVKKLEPDTSAALLVWENLWARNVADGIRNAGGILVDFQRIPHDVVQAAREAVLAEA